MGWPMSDVGWLMRASAPLVCVTLGKGSRGRQCIFTGPMGTTLPLITNGTVRGACPHDCPDTCALITTVENGKAVRIQGDPEHPVTQGFLCAKVNRYLDRTYHHD